MYFENIKSSYHKYLEEQLNLPIDTTCVGDTTYECKEDDKENHPVRPPKENTISITRNEFIDIVKKAIYMPELTFQEKGKLNELWDTFKEFNRDILTSILEDLSQKTNDFSRNFLYYITQIRNLYLKKLSGIKVLLVDHTLL